MLTITQTRANGATINGRVASMTQQSRLRSVEEWDQEDQALKAGGDPPPCPQCQRRGCYAPRFAEPSRKYFACKFCGYWQDVGRPPDRTIRYECNQLDHSVADWKYPTNEAWQCPCCTRMYQPEDAVAWPAASAGHPWRSLPEAGSQAEFSQTWQQLTNRPPPPFGIV